MFKVHLIFWLKQFGLGVDHRGAASLLSLLATLTVQEGNHLRSAGSSSRRNRGAEKNVKALKLVTHLPPDPETQIFSCYFNLSVRTMK